MNTLVIYDSKFGNTKKIAEVIANVFGEYGPVNMMAAADATPDDLMQADMLAMGGPTQAHGASPAIRMLLDNVVEGALGDIPAITFDTRYNMPSFLTGSAAGQIEKMLHKLGCELLMPHESFFISSSEGPLASGELERAAEWARVVIGRLEPSKLATSAV